MILESAPYRFIRKGRSMRHVTAHISIWNELGWIGTICYSVFAAAAPEVLTEGNQ